MALVFAVWFPLLAISEVAGWSSKSLSVPVFVLLTLGCILHVEMADRARRAKDDGDPAGSSSRVRARRRL